MTARRRRRHPELVARIARRPQDHAKAEAVIERLLAVARRWLEQHARTIALVLIILLAASLLRNGIAGLTD